MSYAYLFKSIVIGDSGSFASREEGREKGREKGKRRRKKDGEKESLVMIPF